MTENGGVTAKPLAIGDTIYIGSCDTYFYAIDTKKGSELWAYKTGGPISANAVMDNGVIYFVSYDKHFYAISKDGNLLWRFKTGGINASSPVIHNGVAYFGSSDNYMYALDINSHSLLWRIKTGDEIVSDPVIVGDRIYFGSMDSYFYCIDFKGNILWKHKTNDPILLGAAAYDDSGVYFGSVDERLYALDFNGNLRWHFKTGEQVYNTATVHRGRVYFTGRDRYVYCLDSRTGACIWKYRTDADMYAHPIIHGGKIFAGSNKIYSLDMDGYCIWTCPIYDNQIAMNAVVHNDNILFGAFDCRIMSLNQSNGMLQWSFRTKGMVAPIETFSQILPAPKWDPELFDAKTVRNTIMFNPYTFSNETHANIYGGKDTTGIDKYGVLSSSAGAYKDIGASASAYRMNENKKKADDILKKHFGIK